MNKFQEQIQDFQAKKEAQQQKMIDLSSMMNDIMDLNEEEIEEACHERIIFNVPGYAIGARSFLWHHWIPILVVAPVAVSIHSVGYSNETEEKFFPPNWEVKSKGTASVWTPPDEEIPKILGTIKKYLQG